MNIKQNQPFLGVFTIQKDGRIKVRHAQKYGPVNQYKSKWKDIPARETARFINRNRLVIK